MLGCKRTVRSAIGQNTFFPLGWMSSRPYHLGARAHKNGWLDREYYVKIEAGWNFPPVPKIVTRTALAVWNVSVAMHARDWCSIFSTVHPSIGVTCSYSSRPFLCVLAWCVHHFQYNIQVLVLRLRWLSTERHGVDQNTFRNLNLYVSVVVLNSIILGRCKSIFCASWYVCRCVHRPSSSPQTNDPWGLELITIHWLVSKLIADCTSIKLQTCYIPTTKSA